MTNNNLTVATAESEIPIFSYRADTDDSILHVMNNTKVTLLIFS